MSANELSARAKLLNPPGSEPILPFEDLPADRSDPDWLRVEEKYGLGFGELLALKNARCIPALAGGQHQGDTGSSVALQRNIWNLWGWISWGQALNDDIAIVGKKRHIDRVNLSVAYKCSITEDEKFLLLNEIPAELKGRNELKNHLFIRDCFPSLFDDIVASLPKNSSNKRLSVIGTAGIGKSSFFLYCLHKYLEDPSRLGNVTTNKSFYIHYERSVKMYSFVREDGDGIHFEVITVMESEDTDPCYPQFVDLVDRNAVPRLHTGGVTLIFCSFHLERYKELMKSGWMKIMPTWSIQELELYFNSDHFKSAYDATDQQCLKAFQAATYFGGVIRNNILYGIYNEGREEKINEALRAKGAAICDRFFKHGFGGLEVEISDVLIHRNPRIKEDGSFDFDAKGRLVNFHFASPYVLQELMKLNRTAMSAEAKKKYDAGMFRGGEDGNEFEQLCFRAFKFSGHTFVTIPLLGTTGLQNLNIVFPDKAILELDWKTRVNYLQVNSLYLPPYGNLESGDAFCVKDVNSDGSLTLIILQSTIAARHSIKANGVKVIYDSFVKNSNIHINDTIIVFVTPKNGKLVSKQNITKQKGEEEAENIPVSIRSITTKQYKLENELIELVD